MRSAARKPALTWSQELSQKMQTNESTVLELWAERAAIREFLGNMSRTEAEERAKHDVIAMLTKQEELRL